MSKLPTVSGKELVKFLQTINFELVRVNGSHYRMKNKDGRITTVPVHKNNDLPKGLLRKIIREDLGLELNEFILFYHKFKKL